MGYELMGRAHAALASMRAREDGQGTVEYVGLILLVAVVLGGIVKASHGFAGDDGLATAIANKLKEAVGSVKDGK